MSTITKFINIALNEVGYLEKATNSMLYSKTANAGKNNFTKYANDIDQIPGFYNGGKNGYSWCTVFVDWCLIQAFGVEKTKEIKGLPKNSLGASCTYLVNYYKAIGRFFTSNPQYGDQIFFGVPGDYVHTGIVYKVDDKFIYTIEGNTSSSNGVIANGGSVEKKKYDKNYSRIGGFGRPKWDLIQEEEEDMTQEKFNEMMNVWMKEQATKEPSSWSEVDRKWNSEINLMRGDENGNLMMKKLITREEVLALMHRLVEYLQ